MFALPDHHLIALTGRDAAKFAQAQTMNDVAGLAAGHWQWNGWLTPKGRVVALFALLKLDDDTLWMLLHDADPADFAAQLQRFVFRSKVAIAVRDDLHASGAFAPAAGATSAQLAVAGENDITLDLSGNGGARSLRIAATTGIDDADALAAWTTFDLAHGLPRLDPSQSGQWTPQQLSLDRLHAYSVKKGCYPGQEIVARTHFLGQAKRGLVLFESDLALVPGAQVTDDDRVLGSVVSSTTSAERQLALAVLSLEPAPVAPQVDGNALRAVPLLDGLVR